MDIRNRTPKGKSGQVAINLHKLHWNEILENPNMHYTEMQKEIHKLEHLNKLVKKRTIAQEIINRIKSSHKAGTTLKELRKAYNVSFKMLGKILS